MDKLYIDATVPLRWGPHPPVGIPRVESAIIRQALRRGGRGVRFFMINRGGNARFLDKRELGYLVDLVEGRLSAIESTGKETLKTRIGLVLKSIRSGAMGTGKEFDRVSASYISGRNDRRGVGYQAAKTFVRVAKLVTSRPAAHAGGPDPLADPHATCFVSTAGLHSLASAQQSRPIAARLATVLHDLIPLDHPGLVDRSHARNFRSDVAFMFERCEQIITVSAHTAETASRYAIEQDIRVPPSIAVARLGSFLRDGLAGRKLEPVAALAGKHFALYCSTIEIRKNHITLLKAWTRLIPLLGDHLPKLVFCGRWGWMNEAVEAYLAAHPELSSHLVMLSDMSDSQLGWLYANADFGLYPSLAEGWGLGAVECLDFGLPVLISETPSLNEATQGLMPVIATHDVDGWADAVRRAVDEPAWLDELRMRIRIGYLPISESAFSRRILALLEGEATEGDTARTAPPVVTLLSDLASRERSAPKGDAPFPKRLWPRLQHGRSSEHRAQPVRRKAEIGVAIPE